MVTQKKHISFSNFVSFICEGEIHNIDNNITHKNSLDLSNANIIFEYLNNSGEYIYKFIKEDNYPCEIHPLIDVNDSTNKVMPDFNYLNLSDIPDYYSRSANLITVNFNDETNSNFIYDNGKYCLTNKSSKIYDKTNIYKIEISNILTQFINNTNLTDINNNSITTGTGYLFCGGKIIDIKWSKRKNHPIKITDESGKPICLVSGKIWWIIVENSSYIEYK
jgi:hypothetical protein